MDLAISWTEVALLDFETIILQAAERDIIAAEELRVDLLQTVGILARFPLIGPAYERDRTGRTREVLCGRYRVFYRVQGSPRRVEILTIWPGSMREPRLPGLG